MLRRKNRAPQKPESRPSPRLQPNENKKVPPEVVLIGRHHHAILVSGKAAPSGLPLGQPNPKKMRKNSQIIEPAPLRTGCNLLLNKYVTRNWFRSHDSYPTSPTSQSPTSKIRFAAALEPTQPHPNAGILTPDSCLQPSPFLPFWLRSVEDSKPPKSATSNP